MTYRISVTPRSEREARIERSVKASEELGETIYDFRGGTHKPQVIRLPIDVPVYRMENCRTFSGQQSAIAKEDLSRDFFEKGQESAKAQQAQHEILLKLANQGSESVTPIISVLMAEGQREPILITNTGVVVNGNRRLCAMRELMQEEYVQCAVLPSDISRDEIDDIEADLQARPQTKLDYDWIGDARLIERQVNKKGRTAKEVANRLRRTQSEIENLRRALSEAELYLHEWVKKPGQYELVYEGEQIFSDLAKNIPKSDPALQDAKRAIASSIYKNRDQVSGRIYRLNPAFGKLAPKVLNALEENIQLKENIQLSSDEGYNPVSDDDFPFDMEEDDSGKDYKPIIQALQNSDSKDEIIEILINTCETVIETDKGQRNEQAALRALSQINSKVKGIDATVAGEKTLLPMRKQIEEIRKGLDKIEDKIKKRQDGKSADDKDEE